MTNNEMKKIVAETLLAQLNDPDSQIGKLMLSRERRVDKSVTEDLTYYLEETIDVLMEHLHLEKKEAVSIISEEDNRMRRMIGLNERVEIDHNDYIAAHGKKASGKGTWAFGIKPNVDIRRDTEGKDYVWVSGYLTVSKAAAIAAKELKVQRLWVMS